MTAPIPTNKSIHLPRPVRGPKTTDRTGKKYGRLTFLYPVSRTQPSDRVEWLCRCDCGGEKITRWGQTKSCGCLQKDVHQARIGSPEWKKICADRRARREIEAAELKEAMQKRRGGFDRLTHCTRKAATYRELCPHYIECQDERVFGKKKVSWRYAESDGKCYQVPTDDTHIKDYQRLIAAGGM